MFMSAIVEFVKKKIEERKTGNLFWKESQQFMYSVSKNGGRRLDNKQLHCATKKPCDIN